MDLTDSLADSKDRINEIQEQSNKQNINIFTLGDKVKILVGDNIEKDEVYSIHQVKDENPILYILKNEKGDLVNRVFSTEELEAVPIYKLNDTFFLNTQENQDTLVKINKFFESFDNENNVDTQNPNKLNVPIKKAILKFKNSFPGSHLSSTDTIRAHILQNYLQILDIKKIRGRYVCSKEKLESIEFDYTNFEDQKRKRKTFKNKT